MNAMDFFKKLNDWGPVLFAIGFLAPLIALVARRGRSPQAPDFAFFTAGNAA